MSSGSRWCDRATWGVLALSACLGLCCSSPPTPITDKKAGGVAQSQRSADAPETMPQFALRDTAGHEISSAQFRGKVVLLDFWATWCAPCKKEMPGYERLYRQYRDRGLVVIGIAADSNPSQVAAFAKRLKITYPLLLNGMDVQRYGVKGLPTTMLIDRNGIVRKEVVGFEYTEAFEKALRDLLETGGSERRVSEN